MPALMLVLNGTKRLTAGRGTWECRPGEFLMVHRAGCIDLENVPGGEPPAYASWGLYFPWRLVDLARTLTSPYRPVVVEGELPWVTSGAAETLRPALEALFELKRQTNGQFDPAEQEHRLMGVLVSLVQQGQGHFLRSADPNVSAQVRMLIAAEPARDWASFQLEAKLHMSGATLRRRLADEGTSLRELLREARLHHGLGLLQTTRQPVKAVAGACGYRSVASFSRNFRERFGVEPSSVANE
jgi:AraC-like DNA-binding protein